jgi:hypothetical protein
MNTSLKSLLAASILLFGICQNVNATTISFLSTDTATDKTSSYSALNNFKVETFDHATLGKPGSGLDQNWTWMGSGNVVQNSLSGKYAAPYGTTGADTTHYLSVPEAGGSGNGSITAYLGNTYTYFGLWWGSIDAYNSIAFYKNNVLVQSFTGSEVIGPSPANGNQTAPSTNVYVNFLNLGAFDSFTLTSTSFAFEVDNIAVGGSPVPEPATLLLFGVGIAGLATLRNRIKRAR